MAKHPRSYNRESSPLRTFYVCWWGTGWNAGNGRAAWARSARAAARAAAEDIAFDEGKREVLVLVYNDQLRPRGAFRWSNPTSEHLRDGTVARIKRSEIIK